MDRLHYKDMEVFTYINSLPTLHSNVLSLNHAGGGTDHNQDSNIYLIHYVTQYMCTVPYRYTYVLSTHIDHMKCYACLPIQLSNCHWSIILLI